MGRVEGGHKQRKTMIAKLGGEEAYKAFMREIGSRGGTMAKKPKGFSIDRRSWLDKLLRKPKHAALAGRKGGLVSKRSPAVPQPEKV